MGGRDPVGVRALLRLLGREEFGSGVKYTGAAGEKVGGEDDALGPPGGGRGWRLR